MAAGALVRVLGSGLAKKTAKSAAGGIVKEKFFGKKNKSRKTQNSISGNSIVASNPLVENKRTVGFSPFSDSDNFKSRSVSTGSDNLIPIVLEIEEKVIKIDTILKDSYTLKKKNSEDLRKKEEQSKYKKREDELEGKKFPKVRGLKTPSAPSIGILGMIKRFLFWTFLAWLYDKVIPFLPTIGRIVGTLLNVADFALKVFGGIANILTKFLAGGIRLVNGLTKTLAVLTGAKTDEEIEKFTQKFNMMMDLALLAAMLAGDAGFSVLDLFKKKKGRDAAGKVVQKAGGVFRRGLGRAPQRIAAKVAGKKGATFVKGLTAGAKNLGNKATGNIFRRGLGKAGKRLAIKVGGKAGGKLLGKLAGPIGTVIGAGFEFAGRKSQGQSNLQAGVGTGASVAGALGGAAAGAKGGAAIGALIGSVIPGAGTIVGGAVGGFIGGIAGAIGGGWLAGKAADKVTGADKVGQQVETTVPGKYRGGIVKGYEEGGIIEEGKTKPQESLPGKDVGGHKNITLLFPDPSSETQSNSAVTSTFKEASKSFFGYDSGDAKDENEKSVSDDSNSKTYGNGLKSLKDTSKTLKKIPFIGELMGISVDIAMGQKPNKDVYGKIASKIVSVSQSLTSAENISELSDTGKHIQNLVEGGVSSIKDAPKPAILDAKTSEKAVEQVRQVLTIVIEKGANDALSDIRKEIFESKIKSTSDGGGRQGSGSSGGGDTDDGGQGSQDGTASGDESGGDTTDSSGGAPVSGDFNTKVAKLLENYEGLRTEAYPDPASGAKPYTIGIGATRYPPGFRLSGEVQLGQTITKEEAYEIKAHDIKRHTDIAIGEVGSENWNKIPENVKVALISKAFNYGSLGSTLSDLVKSSISSNNYKPVSDYFRNSLAKHNSGINSWRRNDEAGIIDGGGSSRAKISFSKTTGSDLIAKGGGNAGGSIAASGSEDTSTTSKSSRPAGKGSKLAGELGRFLDSKGLGSWGSGVHQHPEHPPWPKESGHAANSLHYESQGARAIDIGGWGPNLFRRKGESGTDDQTKIIAAINEFNSSKGARPVEFLHEGNEPGGHSDHVHVAYFRGGPTKEGPAKLHEGEFVTDKDTTELVGLDFMGLLNKIENATSLMQKIPQLISNLVKRGQEIKAESEIIGSKGQDLKPELIKIGDDKPRKKQNKEVEPDYNREIPPDVDESGKPIVAVGVESNVDSSQNIRPKHKLEGGSEYPTVNKTFEQHKKSEEKSKPSASMIPSKNEYNVVPTQEEIQSKQEDVSSDLKDISIKKDFIPLKTKSDINQKLGPKDKMQGGGLIGKNIKKSQINNVNKFADYESPDQQNTMYIIQTIIKTKHVESGHQGGALGGSPSPTKNNDNSYSLGRQ